MLFSNEYLCKKEKKIVYTVSKSNITKNWNSLVLDVNGIEAFSNMIYLGFSPHSSFVASTSKKEKLHVNIEDIIQTENLEEQGESFFEHYDNDLKLYVTGNTDFS